MVLGQKVATVEELLELAQRPENANKRLELIGGMIVEMSPSTHENSELALWIGSLLITFVRAHHLGRATGPDSGYQVNEKNYFQPDAAFVSKTRGKFSGVIFPGAPDLAVEVISDSETPRMVIDKVRTYLQAGSIVVLCVYREDQVIDEHRLAEDGETILTRTLHLDDDFSAEDVLPGFKVSLRVI